MSQSVASLPGFREFFPRECAVRNYVFGTWRTVAERYGFLEWEGPALESTELYRRKSGDEITGQLFCFEDKGGREVALRPELTPTLARMAAARHRDYRKPMKWHQIGACYRYEAPQKGRLREFYQWNCDILGDRSPETDAELIALGIDSLRALGFTADDVGVRISDRNLWSRFLDEQGMPADRVTEFLQVIDKFGREKPESLQKKLGALGTSRSAVEGFIDGVRSESDGLFSEVVGSLGARGLGDFVHIGPEIVRGLAYYTGVVFEFFAVKPGLRAIAGGGRYDGLCSLISGGSADLPAAGFAMGDVVLGELIQSTPAANLRLQNYLASYGGLDVYVVIADESRRAEALASAQRMREAGWRTDFPLTPAKVGRQFQNAEAQKARAAIVIGSEYPEVKVKDLASRQEVAATADTLVETVRAIVESPIETPLLAADDR